MRALLVMALAATSTGCSPSKPVPAGPDHPADPAAAEAPEPPAAAEPPAPSAPPAHAHGHDHAEPEPEPDADALLAAEMAAFEAARPVFEEHCASCHTTGAKKSKKKNDALEHFNMDSYPFTGHHAGELGATVRKVLGVDGGKATMPKDDPGAVEGEQLALVVAWARAYDRAEQAGAGYHGEAPATHDHGGHGH